MGKSRSDKNLAVVVMIGLVGSGKSSVAKMLAARIGAKVISGDAIRVRLRSAGKNFKDIRKIAEQGALKELKRGRSVVLDSDHIDPKKLASARELARRAGAKFFAVRVWADFDIITGRIINASYANSPSDFFGGAKSPWNGPGKGAVVKLRELTRRLPHHYKWNFKGGVWTLRKPPCRLLADVNTGTPTWKNDVDWAAQHIISFS